MDLEVFRVTPNVWCLRRRSYFTCSYLVRARCGIVLIDAGMDSHGRDVEHALTVALRAEPSDVTAILLTHWHNDHAAGARAIQDRSDAKVYCHVGDRPQLTGVTATTGVRGWLAKQVPELGPLVLFKGLLGEATPRGVVDEHLVEDGDRIAEEFEVIETPGHTNGHLSFYYATEQVLFAGDALAVIDGRVRFMARSVTPDLIEARRSMIKCLQRPIEHLCPGHRAPLSIDAQVRIREMLERLDAGEAWPRLG